MAESLETPQINVSKTPVTEPPAPEEEKQSPWVTIGLGVLMLAVGIGCYFWFNHLEQQEGGGTFRAHVVIVLLYTMLGKLGVLGVFSLFGVVLLGVGLKGLATGK